MDRNYVYNIDFGGMNMNKVSTLRSIIAFYLSHSPEYEIIEKRIMEHPIRKDLKSFNFTFSDKEKSIRYAAIGCETEDGYCSMELRASFFTGIEEDIEEKKQVDEYLIHIKNYGDGREAQVEATRWFTGEINLDFEEVIKVLVENGVNRLLYKFVRTYPPEK